MKSYNRNTFIRNITYLYIGSALVPKYLYSKKATNQNVLIDLQSFNTSRAIVVNEFSIVDMHCHPSLKMDLWGRKFWRHHHPGTGMNGFRQQVDSDQCKLGHVRGMLVTHYLLEKTAEVEWRSLKALFSFVHRFCKKLANKFENENETNFNQVLDLMKLFEDQIAITNRKLGSETYVITKNYNQFEAAIRDGKIPCAHAIEGGHSLGRDVPHSKKGLEANKPLIHKMAEHEIGIDPYLVNLVSLKEKGVCMMSLAHLFSNDLVDCVEGISADGKKTLKMHWQYDNSDTLRYNTALKPEGRKVAVKMLDIGMIIDLTHATPLARKEVFDLNRARKASGKKMRPIIFSHAGSQEVFDKYQNQYNIQTYNEFKYYNVSLDDIIEISDCEGVIGIIPETFWLTGADSHLHEFPKKIFKYSIPFMVETMIAINNRTTKKNYDNIAIGTDFDGFADASKDFYKAKHIPDLITEMRKYPLEFPDEVIYKIFYQNAMRVLKTGWTDGDS